MRGLAYTVWFIVDSNRTKMSQRYNVRVKRRQCVAHGASCTVLVVLPPTNPADAAPITVVLLLGGVHVPQPAYLAKICAKDCSRTASVQSTYATGVAFKKVNEICT